MLHDLLPECWVNCCDVIMQTKFVYLYLYLSYRVASTILAQYWLAAMGVGRERVLESPQNGPDILDVFQLSRHLSDFLD